ncbi:MAG: septal ring lytic transglycosylase RlpA family protein [Pseudomonadota bacterium]
MAVSCAPSFAAQGCGQASWYALTSQTASGEMMNPAAYTAAHKTLPFGTRVTVTNRNNGRSVTVRINDRGPFTKGRVIDLSKAAASQIGMVRSGHAPVCYKKAG